MFFKVVFVYLVHNSALFLAPSCCYLLHEAECKVLLEKLAGLKLVKKFPAFYGTRRFITAITSVLSLASSIQSIPLHPTSWRSALILSSHLRLGLPSGLFRSGFPTKTLYTPLPSPTHATCRDLLILLDFITRTIVGEEYVIKLLIMKPVVTMI
jgi:hypothetical protein